MTPNEQKAYAEPKDKRTAHQKHFDAIYAVFHQFYQEKLRADLPPHERIRLMLTTQFFDDLELQRALAATDFGSYPSTPADKRAIALTAYFDVITVHNRLAGLKFETVSEKDIAKGKANL